MKNGLKNEDDLENENENEEDFRIKAIRNEIPFEEKQKEIKSFPLSEKAIAEIENSFEEIFEKEKNEDPKKILQTLDDLEENSEQKSDRFFTSPL